MLVTRASPGAEATAARIQQMGGEPILAPMLQIQMRRADTNLDGVQALLFTSTNGVQSFAAQSTMRHVPAFCVGAATAIAAHAAGFVAVRDAGGDVDALGRTVIATLDPRRGALLHVAGQHIAGDLAGALAAHGFAAERRIFYEAVAAARLPQDLFERLRRAPPALDLVLFHSPRAAAVFCALAPHAAGGLIAACMSRKVAQAAQTVPWRRVVVALEPTDKALLTAAFMVAGERP